MAENIDYEQALLNPSSVFGRPEDVLTHLALILRRWTYDASEDCVATEEGMPDGNGDLLRRILVAVDSLADVDMEHSGPNKQHGILRSSVKPQ